MRLVVSITLALNHCSYIKIRVCCRLTKLAVELTKNTNPYVAVKGETLYEVVKTLIVVSLTLECQRAKISFAYT